MMIDMFALDRQEAVMSEQLRAAIEQVLAHRGFVNGPEVAALEGALAARLGEGWHAIGCANGTDALHLMLRAAGIGPGDGVALPALTFVATAEAVRLAGAVPVFVDTGPETGTLCPDSLSRAFQASNEGSLPPLRAVLPVDLFAIPADHARINELTSRHGALHLVDAAHSYGGADAGWNSGTLWQAAATSFYPSKALGCYGDGGAVLTRDADLAARVRAVANHGVMPGSADHDLVGTNSRLDSIQAAVLLTKLQHFDAEIAARRHIAQSYLDALDAPFGLPVIPADADPVWSYFAIRHPRRDALQAHLAAQGVRTVAYYRKPLHQQPAFAHEARAPGGLSGTESFAETLLCLPVHPYLRDDEREHVIAALRAFEG